MSSVLNKKYYLIGFLSVLILHLLVSFITYNNLIFGEVLFYVFISGVYLFFAVLFAAIPTHPLLKIPIQFFLIIGFTLVPIIHLAYFFIFNGVLSEDEFNAIFQTNIFEVREFLVSYLNIYHVLILFLFIVGLLFLSYKKSIHRIVIKKQMYVLIAPIVLALALYFSSKNERVYYQTIERYKVYNEEFLLFEAEQKERNVKGFEASKNSEGELYVIVIGESLNKNHMALYGYHRNTTPLLDELNKEGKINVFSNVYSSHTHTVPVLTKALTQASLIDTIKFYRAPSLVNVYNRAGFETHWISNQIKIGEWDNLVTIIGEQADRTYRFNKKIGKSDKSTNYDEVIFSALDKIFKSFKKNKKNTVVFVHLMGNHFDYGQRHPKEFEIFKDELTPAEFGNSAQQSQLINKYDNSVLYNDYIVSTIIKKAKKINAPLGLMYFSDHSEDVINNNSHHSHSFDFSMVQVPLITYFSEEYKATYPNKIQFISQHKDSLFCNDFVYDFMIGISDVVTNEYTPRYDPSTNAYLFTADESRILSQKRINDSSNFYYHRLKNSIALAHLNQSNRVIPHRVNTFGKKAEINYLNINSFEVDVMLSQNEFGKSYFQVGHDSESALGIDLFDFLKQKSLVEGQKIWLDIKNLSPSNIENVKPILQKITKDFSANFIVESQNMDALKMLSNNFHTSYYLPYYLLEIKDKGALKNKAKEIALQINNSKLIAISFDIELYAFVKQELEHLIDKSIIYHTWDLQLNYSLPNLANEIQSKKYFYDSRIKTILIPFYSNFNY
jgi:heptose-I-phosphate ethanolaminephosphotransferase